MQLTDYNDAAVGRRIKSGLVDAGMTPEDLASRIGVSPDTVRSWITGRRSIKLAYAVRICDVLNWPLDRIAVREEP